MKKLMSSILSLSMALLAIAAPMSANANEGRAIVGPDDGWKRATVSKSVWSIAPAKGQSQVFYVYAGSSTASFTVLNIKLDNARIVDKNNNPLCNKIGTQGSCPTITTGGINNKFTVYAGTNGYSASYEVESAFYY